MHLQDMKLNLQRHQSRPQKSHTNVDLVWVIYDYDVYLQIRLYLFGAFYAGALKGSLQTVSKQKWAGVSRRPSVEKSKSLRGASCSRWDVLILCVFTQFRVLYFTSQITCVSSLLQGGAADRTRRVSLCENFHHIFGKVDFFTSYHRPTGGTSSFLFALTCFFESNVS